MTSLISKIEQLIKREKTTPDRKTKDDSKKSSNEILSELFGAFNADPPKIDDASLKKTKKSKKKHKKEKKKRSHSNSSNDSDDSDYSHKRKKKKKTKSKKRKDRSRSRSSSGSRTPVIIKRDPEPVKVKSENKHVNTEVIKKVKTEDIKSKDKIEDTKSKNKIKIEPTKEHILTTVKEEVSNDLDVALNTIDASLIPMPDDIKLEVDDLRHKLESKKDAAVETDKTKSKIQIKNLKFSAVFEEAVKKAEEEARKRAEKYEEGEYTDSSSSSVKEVESNSTFPKSSDPGGILKQLAAEEFKLSEDAKNNKKSKHSESSHKSSRKDRSRSRKRSTSRSRRSRSRSGTRRRRRRSNSRSRKRSSSRHRSSSKSKRRSSSRSRTKPRLHSPRHRGRRSRSPSGVKLADSEKKRLLEVARRNAINMLKNGAVPAGAAALPPHTRNQVMAAIQSGGKSVDELTDFCKHLSKKEALGELSSVSSNDDGISENEDTIAFHHPFLVKEKAPIVMNIRGGAPLPIKSSVTPVANKDELRLQFPVSSGSQHRDSEWVPVSPKKDNMQVAKLNSSKPAAKIVPETTKSAPLAIEAPPPPAPSQPAYLNGFTSGTQLSSVPALPAPGPQAYPPGIDPPNSDMASIVTQKLSLIRKEQEENELALCTLGFGWSKDNNTLGQFTGTTGAQILTPRELASGTQAWAKKLEAPPDALTRLQNAAGRSEFIILGVLCFPTIVFCL